MRVLNENGNSLYEEKYNANFINYLKNKSVSFAIASDIHYHEHINRDLLLLLVNYYKISRPDYILIPGDLLDNTKFLNNKDSRNFFEYFVYQLSLVASVIITPGNHEIGKFELSKDWGKERYESIEYLGNVSSEISSKFGSKGVYFLNNNKIKIDDFMFYGFSPSLTSYLKYAVFSKDCKSEIENDYNRIGFNMNESDNNILLSHLLPPNISDKDKVDFASSGHWHDGHVPKKLDGLLKESNFGFLTTPLIKITRKIPCRGLYNYGRGVALVSQGFRKFPTDIPLLRFLDKITANDIERIELNNEPNTLKRILK